MTKKKKKVSKKKQSFGKKKKLVKKMKKAPVGKVVKKSGNKSLERVTTGIPNFDGLIQGGFEKDSTNMVVGSSGIGKTIFATQFLIDGIKKGEKCLYVTFEEKKERFYSNMLKFGWNLEECEKKGLFTFLEYTPIKVKAMLEEGGGTIESIILKKKISRIVIDSITSFELLFEDELAKREAALALFGLIRDWEATALVTLEESVDEGNLHSRALEFEVDSIILLYFVKAKGARQRRFEIVKMRGTKHSSKIYIFEIENEGININKKFVSSK
ncbi:MAG: hypothetical protein KJ718_04705 [Nanoarchaeota archaeon]|nr:hypothetical protein [Nanoarchaeota archaeon]MBU1051827.1 hypothetical protein [Nanoarchaeota archaeon]MBU1988442.1 hypothetical protein [Nanoarchaeota archaeon]